MTDPAITGKTIDDIFGDRPLSDYRPKPKAKPAPMSMAIWWQCASGHRTLNHLAVCVCGERRQPTG